MGFFKSNIGFNRKRVNGRNDFKVKRSEQKV